MKIQKLILIFLGLFSLTCAYAERMDELRTDASHIVVGEVEEVLKTEGKESVRYVVKMRVHAIEKGKGLVKGEHFEAECFLGKKGLLMPRLSPSGHSGVPVVGDRVRVFTNKKKSIYEGVYRNWYDVLPKLKAK
jgi:hypothetical protein